MKERFPALRNGRPWWDKGRAGIETLRTLIRAFPKGRERFSAGGGLTRWHSHLEVCRGGRIIIAGFGVALRGHCDPSTWKDQYTTQMLHVWVVPYPGGVFSDDLSTAATTAAAKAALAETKPGQLAP